MLKLRSPIHTRTMNGKRSFFAVVATTAVIFQASIATAQERPRAVDLLPERTSVYVQIDNVQQMAIDFQESNFGRMLTDERISPLIRELYGEAVAAYDDVKEQVGVELDAIRSLPTGEICFAVITPRRKSPVIAFFMDVSEEAGTASALLARMHELVTSDEGKIDSVMKHDVETFHVRGNDDGEIFYILHEDTFVAFTEEAEFDEMLGRWLGTEPSQEKSLVDNRKFTTIMNQCKSVSGQPHAMKFFVDPITLARSLTQDNVSAPLVFGALRVLGLDGVNGIGGSAIFNEKDYESIFHGHVLLSSPREGIFEMIAMKPGVYDPESFVPENCSNYMTSHWDAVKFYSELEKVVDTFTSEGTFSQQVQENINDEVGIDLQKDLIENLAGRITLMTWNNSAKVFNAQSTILAVEVKEVEKGVALVEDLMTKIMENEPSADLFVTDEYNDVKYWKMAQSIQDGQRLRQARRRAESDGRDSSGITLDNLSDDDELTLELRPTQPCMGFIDNHFVITESVECLEYLIDTSKDKHPRLIDDQKFKDTMKDMERLLETRLPSMTAYSRPDVALRVFYDLVGAENTKDLLARGAEDNKYVKGLKRALDENPLPPFEDIAHYFPPQGSFVVNEDTGFHFLIFQRRAEEK